jgi:hypothetical protein
MIIDHNTIYLLVEEKSIGVFVFSLHRGDVGITLYDKSIGLSKAILIAKQYSKRSGNCPIRIVDTCGKPLYEFGTE